MKTKLLMTFVTIAICLLPGCETPAARQQAFAEADYGPPPTVDKAAIESQVKAGLRDPASATFRWTEPAKIRWRKNGFSSWEYGWSVKFWVNAKNGFGGYSGEEPYWLTYIGGELRDFKKPWMVPVADWGRE